MPRNINSAYRIREILNTALPYDGKTSAHQVWAEIFSINEENQQRKEFSISRYLVDMHDEVERVRNEMMQHGFSESLYDANLNACNSIFAVHSIAGNWQQLKQQITPAIQNTLGFCSEILPDEEKLIDEASLDELKKMASDLRECLLESSLPSHTKDIVQKHLDKIENALTSYKIVGAKALEEVIKSAYGEVIANETIFDTAKGSEELGQLSKIWKKTRSVLDAVTQTNNNLGAIQGMAKKGQLLLEFIKDF